MDCLLARVPSVASDDPGFGEGLPSMSGRNGRCSCWINNKIMVNRSIRTRNVIGCWRWLDGGLCEAGCGMWTAVQRPTSRATGPENRGSEKQRRRCGPAGLMSKSPVIRKHGPEKKKMEEAATVGGRRSSPGISDHATAVSRCELVGKLSTEGVNRGVALPWSVALLWWAWHRVLDWLRASLFGPGCGCSLPSKS